MTLVGTTRHTIFGSPKSLDAIITESIGIVTNSEYDIATVTTVTTVWATFGVAATDTKAHSSIATFTGL